MMGSFVPPVEGATPAVRFLPRTRRLRRSPISCLRVFAQKPGDARLYHLPRPRSSADLEILWLASSQLEPALSARLLFPNPRDKRDFSVSDLGQSRVYYYNDRLRHIMNSGGPGLKSQPEKPFPEGAARLHFDGRLEQKPRGITNEVRIVDAATRNSEQCRL
jgi:hypothetical protein